MVLEILPAAASHIPSDCTVHISTALVTVIAARAIALGCSTTRDLRAASPSLKLEGLTVRGAHVIALTPHVFDAPAAHR
ncbi:hypothetical protein C8J57DRAFT_1523636 [Mycena rebaudengoi]|nr:hypothetical protein C8J57DRAFT_1523636 [Mycena rebaudengoi]